MRGCKTIESRVALADFALLRALGETKSSKQYGNKKGYEEFFNKLIAKDLNSTEKLEIVKMYIDAVNRLLEPENKDLLKERFHWSTGRASPSINTM